MQTLSETLGSICVMRNLGQQQLVEFWIGRMRLNHCLDHPAHQALERRRRTLYQRALDQAINLVYMPLVQRVENRPFVGKVLVDRPNTYAGNLGNPIGGDGPNAVALENAYDSIQHSLDRFT